MTNFSSKILSNATSGMRANQAVIANTGNNIANVNTPGYSRRLVDLKTRATLSSGSGVEIGNGVDIGSVRRLGDQFLEKYLREAAQDKSSANIQKEFLNRIEPLFSLTGEAETIGSNLTAFFTAIQDLASDPSSIELRSNFIMRANELATSITTTFNSIADLQREADDRIAVEVETVNSLTSQVAELNQKIAEVEAGGTNEAHDDRDQRDRLLAQLAEKLSFSQVEMADGTVTVSLANGFTLVNGTNSRALSTTSSPSFASGSLPPSLSGGILSYVVYDYDTGAGTSHFDLTQALKDGGGNIGGLLNVRGYNDAANTSSFDADGPLVALASRIEGLARQLLTTVNEEYLGPDRNGGVAGHQASSGGLDGTQPSAYGLFTFTLASGSRDVDGNGLPDDLNSATLGIDNYSSILGIAVSDPLSVAAALDSGTGPPAAAVFAPGDNRNMVALGDLQSATHTISMGSYSLTTTYDQAYNESVTYLGNQVSSAEITAASANDRYNAAAARRDEFSAVSLDEEFTTLIQYQKAFQASARMVRVGSELLDDIIRLI